LGAGGPFFASERDFSGIHFDFNPGVGANFRMFEDHEGRIFIVELHDCFAALAYLRKGELTVKKWWCSLSGMREFAWWSWSDPLPLPVMGVRLLFRAVVRGACARWEQAKTLLHFWQRGWKP
jgi:hypothetical protein